MKILAENLNGNTVLGFLERIIKNRFDKVQPAKYTLYNMIPKTLMQIRYSTSTVSFTETIFHDRFFRNRFFFYESFLTTVILYSHYNAKPFSFFVLLLFTLIFPLCKLRTAIFANFRACFFFSLASPIGSMLINGQQ